MGKRATIYKDDKGYILCPMSKIIAGFYISTEPWIRVYNNEFESKMKETLNAVLDISKDTERVPTPAIKILESEKRRQKLMLKPELKS